MFVIGRQGDQVNLQFSTANLTAPARNGTRLLLCRSLLVQRPARSMGLRIQLYGGSDAVYGYERIPIPNHRKLPLRCCTLSLHPTIQHANNHCPITTFFPFRNSLKKSTSIPEKNNARFKRIHFIFAVVNSQRDLLHVADT